MVHSPQTSFSGVFNSIASARFCFNTNPSDKEGGLATTEKTASSRLGITLDRRVRLGLVAPRRNALAESSRWRGRHRSELATGRVRPKCGPNWRLHARARVLPDLKQPALAIFCKAEKAIADESCNQIARCCHNVAGADNGRWLQKSAQEGEDAAAGKESGEN